MSAARRALGRDPSRVTPAMEDYLKAVYRLRDGTGLVTTQRLAEEVGVSGPSVTNMVKRLDGLGLLRHARHRGVELTEAGERAALRVVRHHRLLELYLARCLGFPWDEAHAEADRLEHWVSAALEARLDAALGHPTLDPHGDPIPNREGTVAAVAGRRLLDLEAGERAVVSRVSDREPDQLRYLGALGLYPGAEVAVLEKLPFEGPLRLRVADAEHVIGRPLAAAVRVTGHAPAA